MISTDIAMENEYDMTEMRDKMQMFWGQMKSAGTVNAARDQAGDGNVSCIIGKCFIIILLYIEILQETGEKFSQGNGRKVFANG